MAAIITHTFGIFVNIINTKHIAKLIKAKMFTMDDLQNFIKEGTINAHTPHASPFNKL